MTLRDAITLLEHDGYKNMHAKTDEPTLHTIITIRGGRLRKPSKEVKREFYMRIPIIIRLELRREVRIFGKTVDLWNIPNAARQAFLKIHGRRKSKC